MQNFLNKISLFIFLTLTILLTPYVALAADYGTKATLQAAGLPTTVAGAGTVTEVVGAIVRIVLSLVGIVFFVLIFYAGFEWMTAQGNSERVDDAKKTIVSSVLGLIIVLAAYAITNFVFSNLAPGGGSSGGAGSCVRSSVAGVCGNVDCSIHTTSADCTQVRCCEWR